MPLRICIACGPLIYRYKQPYPDGSKPLDYGLIAEEVAQIYPNLVVRNNNGQIETVQYHKLTPLLLNELQKEDSSFQSIKLPVTSNLKNKDRMQQVKTISDFVYLVKVD